MMFPRGLVNQSRLKLILLVLVCTGFYLSLHPYRDKCEQNTVEEFHLTWKRNVSDENTTRDLVTETKYQPIKVDSEKEKMQTGDGEIGMQFSDALVFPTPRRDKGFLTIGIPTIKRKKASYWPQTISSLLLNISPTDRKEVLIVIFLADADPGIKETLAKEINSTFYDSVSAGLIQIIQAPESYYPHLDTSKNLYRQSKRYMMWRVKQCYDYAYLLEYSIGLSTYYLQLEDDVVASPGYISSIKQFMEEQNKKPSLWVCLEFSELGFIGKLYRSSDLKKLSDLLKLFSAEQPVDYIYTYFNMMNTQMSQRLRKPTLFQHIGIRSSSPRNIQSLKDRYYDDRLNNPRNTQLLKDIIANDGRLNNPPADVYSSVAPFLAYYPALAYTGEIADGYFWTGLVTKARCTITVVFHQPQLLSHVLVESGIDAHQEDIVHKGWVLVGFTTQIDKDKVKCEDTVVIGVFKNGRVDVDIEEEKLKKKAACLMIEAAKQKSWLIVRNIVVTISNSTIS